MKYKLTLTSDAKNDLKIASNWYNKKRANLGKEFFENVENCLPILQKNPYQFANIYKNVRKLKIDKFPYSILYIVKNEQIIIFAIFHTSRNPETWQEKSEII